MKPEERHKILEVPGPFELPRALELSGSSELLRDFELPGFFELLASPPTFLHPIKANELARRSGGLLFNPSVNKGSVAFFPRQAAFICAAFFVASLGIGSVRFATLVTGSKLSLASVQMSTTHG